MGHRVEHGLLDRPARQKWRQLGLAGLDLGHQRPLLRRLAKADRLQHLLRVGRDEAVEVLPRARHLLEEGMRCSGLRRPDEHEDNPLHLQLGLQLGLGRDRRHGRLLHAVEEPQQSSLVALAAVLPRLALCEQNQRRVALHLEPVAQALLDRCVHLANGHAVRGLGNLIEDRGESLAVPTPRRIELDWAHTKRHGPGGDGCVWGKPVPAVLGSAHPATSCSGHL